MSNDIRIGNQTAFSASRTMEPLEFAVEQGFRAFEWFVDKKIGADGNPAGWDETDMDKQQREVIRRIGESHDILYTVHAPWQANPLHSRAERLLKRSIDFARDIGADLVNLHLYMDRGAEAYVEALTPVIAYAADGGVRLSIENTPLTGPSDFNDTFLCLDRLPVDTDHVGMCLDIGHANLFSGTHNDYIRYIDELAPQIPIIHLHVHENWGDRDSHLTLFTGPARDNDKGIQACLERLRKRRFGGAMILEQWPQPPELLSAAERHLKRLMRPIGTDRGRRHQRKGAGTSSDEESEPHPAGQSDAARPVPQYDINALIAAAHDRNPSWRQRLGWISDLVSDPGFSGSPEQLAALAVYLRFLGTGELVCAEDGRHFRPHHHAGAALAIEQRLEAIADPQHTWILRKIHPWLPSYDRAFQRSEPLTRIRDIAHRNDIPKALKGEIKRRLQNKLHRCAGPEDLKTSQEILERITAPGGDYAPGFVEEFKVFHQELREFFNAGTLNQRLEGLLPTLPSPDGARVRSFLHLKAAPHGTAAQLLKVLEQLTKLRESLAQRVRGADPELAQKIRLADIALEDYAFALLSETANRLERRSGDRDWEATLRALSIAVANVGLSHLEAAECTALSSELRAWTTGFDPTRRFLSLRLKATLDRVRRLTEDYTDRILLLFPPLVTDLGQALGVAGHAIQAFSEGDIRGNLVFQLSRLTEAVQRDMTALLNLPPWEGVAPGESSGTLIRCPSLDGLRSMDRAVIVLLESAQGDEEIPNQVRGILLAHPIPRLSHLGVRARQAGVPFAISDDRSRLSPFEALLNRPVRLQITGDQVSMAPASAGRAPEPQAGGRRKPPVPPVQLSPEGRLTPLGEARVENCGAKATAAARLRALAKESQGLFQAPRGLVLPFGAMEHQLGQTPELEKEYRRHRAALQSDGPGAPDDSLEALRRILLRLPPPREITKQIEQFFGADTPLAVRSSASGEDLDNLAGAGLYDSLVGVPPARSDGAVQRVWASLWNRRAAMSRSQNGIDHAAIHMAVLIQELVEPELSFIMHTADPVKGNPEQAWVELAVGLGETLASAAQPGSPYRLLCDRRTGQASLEACASFSLALKSAPGAQTKAERIDYTIIPLSADPGAAAALGARLSKIAEFLESAFGGPQDVEGVVTGGDIHIVQTRPQQGIVSRPTSIEQRM